MTKLRSGVFLLIILFTFNVYGQDKLPVYIISYNMSEGSIYGMNNNICPVDTTWRKNVIEQKELYKLSPYWKKHKVSKALGWTFAGLGVGYGTFGVFLCAFSHDLNGGSSADDAKIANIAIVPTVCFAIISTSFFINAHNNKKKALSFSMGPQNMTVPLPNGTIQSQPAFAVSMNF